MCEICDGKTHEEVLEGMNERIAKFGFTMQGVEGTPDQPPWIYTVGLVDGFDHPELYLRGYPFQLASTLVDGLAGMVVDGTQLKAGETVGFGNDTHIHLDAVDPQAWGDGDTFNQWWNYYWWRGEGVPDPSALEVRLCGPPPWFSDEVESHRPYRGARRAATQRRHLRSAPR
jgi:hypothetical protein